MKVESNKRGTTRQSKLICPAANWDFECGEIETGKVVVGENHRWLIFGAKYVLCYCVSLVSVI
jgi:hypothetical protein